MPACPEMSACASSSERASGHREQHEMTTASPRDPSHATGTITVRIAGRTGTFVLQDRGSLTGTRVTGRWSVVPGSGTGELAGLRGDGGFAAAQVRLAALTVA